MLFDRSLDSKIKDNCSQLLHGGVKAMRVAQQVSCCASLIALTPPWATIVLDLWISLDPSTTCPILQKYNCMTSYMNVQSKSIRHKIVYLSSMRIAICFEQVISISRLTPFYKRRSTFPFDTHMNAALVCLLLTFISWPWVPGHDIIFFLSPLKPHPKIGF